MPDYSDSKIYKIIGGDECYIGSTVQRYLSNRMVGHRSNYKNWKKNGARFISSFILFEKYGVENCRIELIEIYPCSCVEELRKREGEFIRKETCVNKFIPGRTIKEYREEHKEKIKEYREEHKEKIKEKMKEYYEEHKEQIKEQNKEYREEHKEQIKERKSMKFICECGATLRIDNKAHHNRSIKHLTFLKE
jgi:uncharacterized protein YciI